MEEELLSQIEDIPIYNIGNLILVNLGARSACFLQDPRDVVNFEKYHIKHTKYPELTREYYKVMKEDEENEENEELIELYNKYYESKDEKEILELAEKMMKLFTSSIKKYQLSRDEIPSLLTKRVIEVVKKHYPDLYVYPIYHGNIVSKKPLSKYQLKKLEYDSPGNEKYLGKIIDYPCYKNFSSENIAKLGSYSLSAITTLGYSFHIFGNTSCTETNGEKFRKLAKKYEKVLKSKNSILRAIVDKVIVEV